MADPSADFMFPEDMEIGLRSVSFLPSGRIPKIISKLTKWQYLKIKIKTEFIKHDVKGN